MTTARPGPWLLAILGCVLLYAHLRALGPAWSGDAYLGCPLAEDRCDTLFTLTLAHQAMERLGEAWAAGSGATGAAAFLVRDAWTVAVQARLLNLLDVLLLVAPLRAVAPLGPALLALHLGLLLLHLLGGYAFGRALGLGALPAAASGLTAGTAGIVLESVTHARYAQALLVLFLAVFAGLVRTGSNRPGPVVLLAAGTALALAAYWLHAVILLPGVLTWVVLTRPDGRHLLRILAGLCLGALLAVPLALPVLETTLAGTEPKLSLPPWPAPFLLPSDPAWGRATPSALALLDAVAPQDLLSVRTGWLWPPLPLLPLALWALRRPEGRIWGWLAALGAVLSLGPLPGTVVEFTSNPPTFNVFQGEWVNHAYVLVHRFVPLAARMYHPDRWAVLCSVATCALVGLGVRDLEARHPRGALALLAGGLAWATWAGPWPLPLRPFPGAVERGLRDCTAVILAPQDPGRNRTRAPDDLRRLQGVARKTFLPTRFDPDQGLAPPLASDEATSKEVEATMESLLAGDPPDVLLPAGSCVVLDPATSREPPELVVARLAGIAEGPFAIPVPAGCLPGGTPTDLLVWHVR